MPPSIILFDYPFSPYSQKIRLLLAAAEVKYQRCEQPWVLPRPDLQDLQITYRRIPVMAMGKDVYCDTAAIIDVLQQEFGGLKSSPEDAAYEDFGNNVFQAGLACVNPALLTEDFIKDRVAIFPILARKDFKTIGPSGRAEFRANLDIIEKNFLANANPFIGGLKPALADIHLVWSIRWILTDLGVKEWADFGKERFPKIWKLIESLPAESDDSINGDLAKKYIHESQPQEKQLTIPDNDLLGLKAGTKISVESTDSAPGATPQYGKLLAVSDSKVVISLENGIHLHFPKRGYIFREA